MPAASGNQTVRAQQARISASECTLTGAQGAEEMEEDHAAVYRKSRQGAKAVPPLAC